MRCPRCKYLQEKADFCSHCGRDMRETVLTCPDCGKRNKAGSLKCKCGKILQELPVCVSCGTVAVSTAGKFCAECGKPFDKK